MSESLQKGKTLQLQDKSYEALSYLQQATQENPLELEGWVLLCQCCLDRQDDSAATIAVEHALQIDPQSVVALSVRARLLAMNEQLKEAFVVIDQALTLDPHSPIALTAKGKILSKVGQNDAAIQHYDMALQSDPMYTDALLMKAALLQELGRNQEGLVVARGALSTNPQSLMAQVTYGFFLTLTGQHREALKIADTLIEQNPIDPRPWALKGAVLGEMGKLGQSQQALNRSAELSKQSQLGAFMKQEADETGKEHRRQVRKGIFGFIGKMLENS